VNLYVVTFERPRKSLVKFKGISAVNKEMYIDFLHLLRDAFRRKRPR